jgi:molybdopterin converting factor small subunit
MATVHLRAPLKDLAGGNRTVEVDGSSVGEVLRTLEGLHPRIVGWVLDEHGRVRPHVNVFLDGERVREDAPVEPGSTLQVLPSISGGFGGSRSERRRARAEPPGEGGAT